MGNTYNLITRALTKILMIEKKNWHGFYILKKIGFYILKKKKKGDVSLMDKITKIGKNYRVLLK